MTPQSYVLHQTLINPDEETPQLHIQIIDEKELTSEILDDFLANISQSQSIGLSPAYSSGRLVTLALAAASKVLLVHFSGSTSKTKVPKWDGKSNTIDNAKHVGRKLLEERVLCRPHGHNVAFDLAPLVLLLFSQHNLRLTNGVDIQSCCAARDRHEATSIKFASGNIEIFEDNIKSAFREMEYDPEQTSELALRAWVSQYITQMTGMEDRLFKALKVNTLAFSETELEVLAKFAHDGLRQDMKKPQQVVHSASTTWDAKKSHLNVKLNRFQNRMRKPSVNQHVRLQVEGPNGSYTIPVQAGKALGKTSSVASAGYLDGKVIRSVVTVGSEAHTSAEAQKASIVLRVLQGSKELLTNNPWVQNIWFSSDSLKWPSTWPTPEPPTYSGKPDRLLNDSQLDAIQHMLSLDNQDRIVLVQGPPGTGKTSVISCFVEEAISAGYKGIWLIAQSNVAVKNIAEKLATSGFMMWKLLVSEEFHFEWHEHLYKQIATNIIQSHEFKGFNPYRSLKGYQVILCTLSMLSSPLFKLSRITNVVPIHTLVVDEASQIEIAAYMPAFTNYETIRKVCFIGDDKQLPPHGQEDIAGLQSIFELANLRRLALFLDTQYRMPPQIGIFISKAIYDGKLLSNPLHPVKNSTMACHFVDVVGSKEKVEGKSWMNVLECSAVLTIARQFESDGRNYRIITPYDAQRSLLEAEMKAEGLQWGDKCFNVDSFQGNEDDFIIISLVRSRELGFLKNLRRTNVMLTRCKRGMVICTSRAFLEGRQGSKSLVGQLSTYVGEKGWLGLEDLEQFKFGSG